VAEAVVVAFLVVLRYPGFHQVRNLLKRAEQVGVQHLLAVGSVEALEKAF
jgi:hypothetical protein